MATKARFEGVRITLGSDQYVVPPLTLKQLRELGSEITSISELAASTSLTQERMQPVMRVCLAALNRNYPELTMEALEELVDMRTVTKLVRSVLGVSGLEESEPEKQPAGSQ
jgi:hypothetical protein